MVRIYFNRLLKSLKLIFIAFFLPSTCMFLGLCFLGSVGLRQYNTRYTVCGHTRNVTISFATVLHVGQYLFSLSIELNRFKAQPNHRVKEIKW